jgi:hypothetical protein
VVIMTRSEFDDIRAHIAAESAHASDLLQVAHELLDDLEQVRTREAALRSHYFRLLKAARAAVAADAVGDPAPLAFLMDELDQHGPLPSSGQEARRSTPSGRIGRCVGVSRTLPH